MQANIALVCAGQGAQAVGMGRDLLDIFPDGRTLFDQASDTLGFDLARICFEGPETELLRSDVCQPAIFTVSVICARALQARLPALAQPGGMAGLSLGEWTALHLAGAISFVDALEVLQARGRFMQEACEAEPGAMLSVIGLDSARLEQLAGEAGVEVANFNSPEQTVLSGRRASIARAEQLAR
ncbi:MAG: ACP S-malonyltransferase, partial [Lentisphaerae bacterium]|nr:ACP S-malonyltransferase [Lentisphaerota bacterium]